MDCLPRIKESSDSGSTVPEPPARGYHRLDRFDVIRLPHAYRYQIVVQDKGAPVSSSVRSPPSSLRHRADCRSCSSCKPREFFSGTAAKGRKRARSKDPSVRQTACPNRQWQQII